MRNKQNDFEDIDSKEFYDLSIELDEIKKNMSSSQSSVNRNIYMRIYYAVFLFLREWLKKHTNYHSWAQGEHRRLANFIRFKGPFNSELNEIIYRKLIKLKKLRHQADYKIRIPNQYSFEYNKWDFTTIDSAFTIAEDIVKTFNEFESL